jgi:hypothetical protein
MVQDAKSLLESLVDNLENIRDTDHPAMGEIAAQFTRDVYAFLLKWAEATSVKRFAEIQSFFGFDLTEKLRELIIIHASRSRYLY